MYIVLYPEFSIKATQLTTIRIAEEFIKKQLWSYHWFSEKNQEFIIEISVLWKMS